MSGARPPSRTPFTRMTRWSASHCCSRSPTAETTTPYPGPGTERGYILVRLMVDDRFQGHGYGRAALDAIVALVRDRELPAIRLSVVPENKQALEFYRRNGFAETGEIHGGEIHGGEIVL